MLNAKYLTAEPRGNPRVGRGFRGSALPGGARRQLGSGLGAFTLGELLVVLVVIILLLAILTPYLGGVLEQARSMVCRNHLRLLAQTMHGNRADGAALLLPSPSGWVGQALRFGSPDLLICPKDDSPHSMSREGLKNLYVLQYAHDGPVYTAYVEDLLGGRAVSDDQVWIDWWLGGPKACQFSKVCNCCWDPSDLRPGQHVLGVDGSTAIKITLGDTIRIEALQTCFSVKDPGGSRHYLRRGPAAPPEADEEILHLTGKDYHVVDPRSPVELIGVRTSYGMSAFVEPRSWRPRQILLMDANALVVGIDDGLHGERIAEDVLVPRHLRRVNVVRADQSVRPMSVLEVRWELDRDAAYE